jgi:selenocysteine lyase/cysteine desulfurase
MSFSRYRQYFPITSTDIYLNHAALSPLSTKVLAAGGQDPVSGKIISGIYSFTGPQEQEFFNYLQQKRIHISLRGDVLRFAPHFYNTIGEMDEVVRMCEAYKNT